MTFVNPALLWVLPVAAAPILIHLLFRWRHRAAVFSDLTLLREAVARVMPRRRLEEWLLVAARSALVALLVLAFARPVFHGGAAAAAAEKESLDLVILLDGSYSMGAVTLGRPRFERAKAVAASVLRSLRPQDRAAVVLFSDRIEASSGELQAGAGRLIAWLGRASPGLHATDYRLALESAFSLLSRSAAGRKAVLVLSDNARHGFRTLDPRAAAATLPFFDPKVKLAGVAWDEEPANVALEGAELREGSLRAAAGLSGKAGAATDVTLWAGNRAAGKQRAALKPGRNELAFAVAPATGVFSGRVEARHDALAVDDAFHFAFSVREAPRVLVVESRGRDLPGASAGYFVKRALESQRAPFAPVFVDPADLGPARLAQARAALVLSPSAVPPAGAAALERFVREGGGLWAVADEGPGAFGALAPFLPARAPGPAARSAGLVPAAAARWRLPFAWEEFDLGRVERRHGVALQPREGAEVEFQDARGLPLLVSGRLGGGRILVAGAALSPAWTNLPLKPVFAPWLAAGLARLTESGGGDEAQMLRLEELYVRSWKPPETPPGAVTVIGPEGAAARVPVNEGRLQYAGTDRPGLYRVFPEGAAGRSESVFAVNLDPALRESDLAREPEPPWLLLREETFAQDFQRVLFGQEARHWFLATVLLLLVAETWLATKGREGTEGTEGREAKAPARERVAL